MKIYFVISQCFDDRIEYVRHLGSDSGTTYIILHAMTFEKYEQAENSIRDFLPSGVYHIEKVFAK